MNEDQFKWDLSSDFASFGNTQFEKYIPEESLHGTTCEVHPIPNNLNQVKKMDEFLKYLLKQKNKNNSLVIDKILGKIQKKALSLTSPLSKVWLKLENVKKSDAPPLSLDKIRSLLEQNICLMVKQVSRFCPIKATTFFRECSLLRRQKTF